MINHLILSIKNDISKQFKEQLDMCFYAKKIKKVYICPNLLDLGLQWSGRVFWYAFDVDDENMIDSHNLYVYIGWNGWNRNVIRLNDITICTDNLEII